MDAVLPPRWRLPARYIGAPCRDDRGTTGDIHDTTAGRYRDRWRAFRPEDHAGWDYTGGGRARGDHATRQSDPGRTWSAPSPCGPRGGTPSSAPPALTFRWLAGGLRSSEDPRSRHGPWRGRLG